MKYLTTFQLNTLNTGHELAAEIASSSPERSAFVVIGSYIKAGLKILKPSKFLNSDQSDLYFWIRKYEVNKADLDKYITYEDLFDSTYQKDIERIEELEHELAKYIQDFSLLEPAWKTDNPLP